jgi:hypothetical protein
MKLFSMVFLVLLLALPASGRKVPQDLSWVRGFNYTPASVDHEALWMQYNDDEVNRDMGYARSLQLNEVRVFVRYAEWAQDRAKFHQSFDQFMEAAAKHHIGVMLVLAPPGKLVDGLAGQEQIDADAKLKEWVLDLVKMAKDKPSMAFWDVANEPDWNGYPEARRPEKDREHRMQLARAMADLVHSADKRNPVTVGCFREKCMEELESYTDVLSFHDYSPTTEQIDGYIEEAKAFAAKVHKPVFNTELGCVGRANPYDVMLHEYKKADLGFYIWELMITKGWGDVHGVFYPDGSVRDPAIAAAVMGIFRNDGENVVLEDPDREGWVASSVADGKKWLAEPNPEWKEGLRIAEIQANLLQAAQLIAMRYPPTRTVKLLREGAPDIPALQTAIRQYTSLLEPYIDKIKRHSH